MKRRMVTAIVLAIILAVALAIFIALYIDETKRTQRAYRREFTASMKDASYEIGTYLDRGTDFDRHYRMTLSDLGTARSMIFLLESDDSTKAKAINELHYCFVLYPEQMKGKLEETKQAIDDITDNLDKGYDEVTEIVESVDKMGK